MWHAGGKNVWDSACGFVMATVAIAWLGLTATGHGAEAKRPPNVVVVLADDLGFADLGCYGSEIETPNLDRLAAQGLRFSQFYNTARCWTSRASLMTGLYPHQARMAMNYGEQAPPAYRGNIPRTVRLLSESLGEKQYRCYHVGKWHLNRGGQPNDSWPLGRGFHHSLFLGDHDNYFVPKSLFDDEQRLPVPSKEIYVTSTMSDTAVRYLAEHAREHADRPFFLYLAYTAPHFPLHAPADVIARYRGRYRAGWDAIREARHKRQRELGLTACPLSPRDPDAVAWDSLTDAERDSWDVRMATYAAMIHVLDQGVGQVIAQLEAMKSFDDTLILFLSDNGSSAEFIVRGEGDDPAALPGSRKTFKCLEVGWSGVANAPFRMHKMWVHEGGISSPLIAHWPAGKVPRGQLTHEVSHIIDIVPTVLELAGITPPDETRDEGAVTLPGRSLVPVLRGETRPAPEFLFWEHQGNRAIRKGDWKLVAEHNGPWELYNLAEDRSETNNLAAQKPEDVQRMEKEWSQFAAKIGVVDWNSFPQSRGRKPGGYRMK